MRGLTIAFAPHFTKTNPYLDQLARHLHELRIKSSGIDYKKAFLPTAIKDSNLGIVHLHWLHKYADGVSLKESSFKLLKFISGLIILKVKGLKIVWTAHNIESHEKLYPTLDKICTNSVALLADAIIVHSESAKKEVLNKFNSGESKKIYVIPHANYIEDYENSISKKDARKILGLPDESIVMLFFGLIRPYKGIPELLKVFKKLNSQEVYLVIAGKSRDDNLFQLIEQEAKVNQNIKPMLDFIPQGEVQTYMNACDVVVCPYRQFLTSGVLVLAASFGKACIAPNIDCVKEVLDESGGWLYQSESEDSLLKVMKQAVERKNDLHVMGQYNLQLVKKWGWNQVARETLKVYQKCLEP